MEAGIPEKPAIPSSHHPIIVLLDTSPGHKNQALGVAEKLNLPFESIQLEYSAFAKLPNIFLGRNLLGLTTECRKKIQTQISFKNPLIISCGRRTAPVARWIKSRNPSCRLVHIMDPECGFKDFDLIALPVHDDAPHQANNIFRLTLAPHRLTEESLQKAAAEWEEKFSSLKKPVVGVIAGGATKKAVLSKDEMERFGSKLNSLAKRFEASLIITTSPRTGKEAEKWLLDALDNKENFYPYGQNLPNPYPAIIALADAVVVTGDSVSMISEACYSGMLTLVFSGLSAIAPKHREFLQNLYRLDMIHPFTSDSVLTFPNRRVRGHDSAKDLAEHIRQQLLS